MSAVLELAIDEARQSGENGDAKKDTWILRLPKEICDREGFADGTLVSLTIKNSGINAKFIRPPSKEIQEISEQILEEDYELHKELKRLGD
jgi:hypothetical protein